MENKLDLNNFPVIDMTQEDFINLKEKNKQVPIMAKVYLFLIIVTSFCVAVLLTKIPALDKILPSWLQWKTFENSNSYIENVFWSFIVLGILGVFYYWRHRFRLLEDINEGKKIVVTLSVVSKKISSSDQHILELNVDNHQLKDFVVPKEKYELAVIGSTVEVHVAKKSKELLHYKITL